VLIAAHRRWRERITAMTAGLTKRVEQRFFWVRVERYDRAP
jgi:hypothetical protein